MRAMIFVTALACAALTGCDQPGQTPAPAPTVAVASPQPAAMPPPPVQQVAQEPRHHRRAWRSERRTSRSEYAQSSDDTESDVSTYGTVSDSRSSYIGEASGEAGYAPRAGGGLWVDGYGRGYFTAGHIRTAGTMRGKRLSPWHGYDAGCDR